MAERFFNTAGPNIVEENYTLDPLGWFNLSEILLLIKQKRYFVLQAPRQSGKTTCMLALRDYLNKTGDYTAVYANIEGGQGLGNDVGEVIGAVCSRIAFTTRIIVHDDYPVNLFKSLRDLPACDMLTTYLSRLSEELPKPLVLFLDEMDSLIGDSLVSVLGQLRSGYDLRPYYFPQSIILCGVRDVRDDRFRTFNKEIITGGSAFNIKTESLRLGDFTPAHLRQELEKEMGR